MTEHETVDAEVVEEVGVELEISAPAPATLFRTDEPDLIIARATGVADALKRVLVEKQLTSNISGKEYVKVEGWTLCGTMLGVFPVVEWTRPVEGGWEARVECRTRDGAVVGAAEAECLRSERNWKDRDDYALRSMAQTRATSKALRGPLGFIVTMAGFEATPGEEMPTGAPEPARSHEPVRKEGAQPYPIPTSWPKVKDAFRDCDNPDESEALYLAFLEAALHHQYGKLSLKEITSAERETMRQKAAGAACWLHDTGAGTSDVPFDAPSHFTEDKHRAAWKSVLGGADLQIPNYEPPPTESSAEAEAESYDEEAARIAAETFAEAGRDDA